MEPKFTEDAGKFLGKRKRPWDEFQLRTARRVLSEQIDLEIALKKKGAEEARARIAWGSLVKDTLVLASASEGGPRSCTNRFESAALSTFHAIGGLTSCHYTSTQPTTSTRCTPTPSVPDPPPARRSTKHSRKNEEAKTLYIKHDSGILRLSCPDCQRFNFPTLQGLLNHVRLAHARPIGTHEECIAHCGIIVSDPAEAELVQQTGVQIPGFVLPSVKGMFERAVGLLPSADGQTADVPINAAEENVPLPSATHLSRTLGHHAETPALAPFLGKKVRRRCIHVYEPDGDIDVVGTDDLSSNNPKRRWKRPLRQRTGWSRILHEGGEGLGENSATHVSAAGEKADKVGKPEGGAEGEGDSRFHIRRRVIISDLSQWIPATRRDPSRATDTHKWMLTVTSPSYSQHVSTFLTDVTFSCVTQPPIFEHPLTLTEPPYAIRRTTDKPFLARVTFRWAGPNKPLEIEHWVDIDPFKAGKAVLGDEQILDVDLDKNTPTLPLRDVPPLRWNDAPPVSGEAELRAPDSLEPPSSKAVETAVSENRLPVIVHPILKKLLVKLPLTMEDVKTKVPPTLPYTLPKSRVEVLSYVTGRRKSIEKRHASLLHKAFQSYAPSDPTLDNEDLSTITTTFVYRWMEIEGVFVRPTPPPSQMDSAVQSEDTPAASPLSEKEYCAICGKPVLFLQPASGVPGVKEEGGEKSLKPICCASPDPSFFSRMPLVDIKCWTTPDAGQIQPNPGETSSASTPLAPSPHQHLHKPRISSALPARTIMTLANPSLTTSIRALVSGFQLPAFHCGGRKEGASGGGEFPISELGSTPAQVDRILAPYAALAMATERFLVEIVACAIDAASTSTVERSSGRSLLAPELAPSSVLSLSPFTSGTTAHPTTLATALSTTLSIARKATPKRTTHEAVHRPGGVGVGAPPGTRLLTPAHVYRGMSSSAFSGMAANGKGLGLIRCVGRVGVLLDNDSNKVMDASGGAQPGGHRSSRGTGSSSLTLVSGNIRAASASGNYGLSGSDQSASTTAAEGSIKMEVDD
ncbi:hypothetical protein BOTBODRAFT_169546 [Botryobasidium botryosum FD-172 SS1]|uniref:YEATS domain-containing protein n=1 Tax=Botryobasidium botryosum (strain FD-172 SS1) TaxID=930990 RepID=A0A067N1P1_BOTB1|nr:hypothetical protein BOTBODRAFT_169546 [Botryobasidium botryosum FD-172 SS1]